MRDDIAVRILILGGTKFLGRAVAEAAVARGHALTLFNRGQTNPELFPEVEKLRGDREGDLGQLAGHVWDVVVDTSGNVPWVVTSSAALLSRAAAYYLFVSTRSVYAPPYRPGFDESAPTVDPDNGSTKDPGERYGALKLRCERVVAEIFPDAHAVIRPALIVGPHDPSGRFTYWPLRIARGAQSLRRRRRSVRFSSSTFATLATGSYVWRRKETAERITLLGPVRQRPSGSYWMLAAEARPTMPR